MTEPPDASAKIIGKSALAKALGWSRPTLDKRLKVDPLFPVHKRGDQGGGWGFDLAKITAYLGGRMASDVQISSPSVDVAQLKDVVIPIAAAPVKPRQLRSAYHHGEATARQRKDEADASLKELQLAEKRRLLIPVDDVERVSTDIMGFFSSRFDSLPFEMCKKLDLPDASADFIQSFLDEIRVKMHTELVLLLENPLDGGSNSQPGAPSAAGMTAPPP